MDDHTIECPYCGEQLEIAVDWSVRHQEYVEDCQVCCQPMVLSVEVVGATDPPEAVIQARTESG